ncbi:hypothetical protein KFL_009990020 [Klebsormidium nitens]|uniref:Uncharacterized protein n=1 Tax=Klebsormidium nitens TaxID=105231 RepID=A0A1Y1IS84_KLENI|nr:hypothetical protein KFL_009990020 [Klebsormidium nitens]|eukprot:GAQ92379.1 hypothetical protein KFL_009990020 [Klebsormidium nitens]
MGAVRVERVQDFEWNTGAGGAAAQDRCQNEGTVNGCLDPHFVVQTSSGLASQDFSFDFHGLANKIYCMLADIALQLNVRMFGIPPASKVIERKSDLGDDFFTGTWMDAIGFVYTSKGGAPKNLAIELDHDKARSGAFPFRVVHDGEDLSEILVAQEGATWTSQDGAVTVSRPPNSVSILSVDIKEVLNMVVSSETEEEIIVEPRIYFLNFELKNIVTTPSVHGFLGQMYAPGAIEERLAMGTLEGFRHREYVEGTDEEYETSDLTATDCSFNRFGKAQSNAVDLKGTASSDTTINRRLLQHSPSIDTGIIGLASSPFACHLVNKRLGAISISCEANGL